MKKRRGRENVYSHEIFSSREVWKKYRLDVCGEIRQPGASRATKANPPTNFQVPSSAKPEWRINEETTGCRFISLVTVFPASLLRLPCTTTTMATRKRYTRANLPSVWKEREREKAAIVSAAFTQRQGSFTRFFLLPRRLILRVVAFFLRREFDSTRTAYPEARYRTAGNFPTAVSTSFISSLSSHTR